MKVLEISSLEWANFIVGSTGAVATVAALVVAIFIGVHEARQFRKDAAERDADRRAEREAQERSQAEKVSAIASVDREPSQRYSLGQGRLNDDQVHYASADVHNSSSMPIYDVRVMVPKGDKVAVISVAFVPGGGTGHVHLPPMPNPSLNGAPLDIVFRDAGDRWWSRCSDGHLFRCAGDPYPEQSASHPHSHGH